MTVQACAEMVRRGDPDRFLATMAAPPAARAVLFPIYAFNIEVSRAPWLTQEPMIAEMRLQWWRDALEEIAQGATVRRHEVVEPLSGVVDARSAADLDHLIAARRHDIGADPFASFAALEAYLADTGGTLMAVATRALGGTDTERARSIGQAGAAANYMLAVPTLIQQGRQPLTGDPVRCIRDLAEAHLARLKSLRKGAESPALRQAGLSAWRARGLLQRAARNPQAVLDGQIAESEFARRAGLLRAQILGR
ncbi:squalene/phytoene synthase family protein [Oceaniglobus ichthyenteri]|uniref:squalene/phytoene synthase family protein n=1 Tax=Oceaniglobus ichthyenteri TaxID=2136177 RepID=UPI000D3CB44A|nr:squalene/phytoene synthase family protein [Oceaniglobus ichthyenteri]